MSFYDLKPERFLIQLYSSVDSSPGVDLYCAGFELEAWRCKPFALHLMDWLQEYALPEEELDTNHANAFVKLREAARRVYTTPKHKSRGEVGEIALHAICRDFFSTIPISPRVFYKSASNDVIKSFDLVHARFPEGQKLELWLGESKLYTDPNQAISSAISSINEHIEQGFLTGQKLLLGPQIPKTTPHYEEISKIFKSQTSIDEFIDAAVFVVGILCDSKAAQAAKKHTQEYIEAAKQELANLADRLSKSGLTKKLRLVLVYVPLASKDALVSEFDQRLKAIQ